MAGVGKKGKSGRKSYAEELRIKESLAEIAPKMFAFVNQILESGTNAEKMQIVTKILPKMIPQQLDLGNSGQTFSITIAKEIAEKHGIKEGVSQMPQS